MGGQESRALGGVWCSSRKDLHLGGHLPSPFSPALSFFSSSLSSSPSPPPPHLPAASHPQPSLLNIHAETLCEGGQAPPPQDCRLLSWTGRVGTSNDSTWPECGAPLSQLRDHIWWQPRSHPCAWPSRLTMTPSHSTSPTSKLCPCSSLTPDGWKNFLGPHAPLQISTRGPVSLGTLLHPALHPHTIPGPAQLWLQGHSLVWCQRGRLPSPEGQVRPQPEASVHQGQRSERKPAL